MYESIERELDLSICEVNICIGGRMEKMERRDGHYGVGWPYFLSAFLGIHTLTSLLLMFQPVSCFIFLNKKCLLSDFLRILLPCRFLLLLSESEVRMSQRPFGRMMSCEEGIIHAILKYAFLCSYSVVVLVGHPQRKSQLSVCMEKRKNE